MAASPGAYLNHNPSNACNKPKQIDTLDAWGNQQRKQSEMLAVHTPTYWGSLQGADAEAIHRLVDSYSNDNFRKKPTLSLGNRKAISMSIRPPATTDKIFDNISRSKL